MNKTIFKGKKPKISAHHDADGITSAVLIASAFGWKSNKVEVEFPEAFGDVSEDADFVVDMHPLNDKFEGTVFDHHSFPPYPKRKNRSYKLIHDDIPASAVVYNHFKDSIPIEKAWKVVVGCVGDMQPEAIPINVFKEHPALLSKESWFSWEKDEADEISLSLPQYKLLSSPINAASRLGLHSTAFEILLNAKSPADILFNKTLNLCKTKQKAEVSRVKNTWGKITPRPLVIKDLFMLVVVDSELPVQGMIATAIESKNEELTVIAINRNIGALSIRGTFSNVVSEAIADIGCDSGGHSSAMGGALPDKKPNEIYDEMVKLLASLL